MPDAHPTHPTLPDVLGAITGGDRALVGVVQTALAAHPAMVAPGRPFELILLVQNVCDATVEVTATLHLPKGVMGKQARFVATLPPAAAGFVRLPVAVAPDTPPNSTMRLGVEVDVRMQTAKPARLRGGSETMTLNAADFTPETVARVRMLRALSYTTKKPVGRTALETTVTVGTPTTAMPALDAAPGYVSLWTLAEMADATYLVRRYGETIKLKALPQLRREATLKPLVEATLARFAGGSFTLKPDEALMIAKVMALILEYSAPQQFGHPQLAAGVYNLLPVLAAENTRPSLDETPAWFKGYLRLVAREERALLQPVPAIVRFVYDALLRDAMMLAFELVATTTGEDVGSEREKDEFVASVVARLQAGAGVEIIHAYMPLVIGGIVINEQIATSDDNIVERLRALWIVLDERRAESDESAEPVLDLASNAIERALQTYGFRRRTT